MKLEDLGINSKTRHHNKQLTRSENCFLGLLWVDHCGAENKIAADELAILFNAALEGRQVAAEDAAVLAVGYKMYNPKILNLLKRNVRTMQNHLLMQHDHISILSRAGNGGGYWVADSKEEAEKFFDTFRQRGLTGLVKASRGKKSVMVEMMTQFSFEFEDLVDKSGVRGQGPGIRRGGASTAMTVVDAFLEKMLSNPEKYAEDIKKLGRKFGSVLLPQAQVAEMQHKAAEMQEILAGLTG